MSKVADDLRKLAENGSQSSVPNVVHKADGLFTEDGKRVFMIDVGTLEALADRIDMETLDLPIGADGKTIRIGETVYRANGISCDDGYIVVRMEYSAYGCDVSALPLHACDSGEDPQSYSDFASLALTHTSPDSYERIAEDLDDFRVSHCGSCLDRFDDCDLRKLVARIRKQAGDAE